MAAPLSKSDLETLARFGCDLSCFRLDHGTFGQRVLPNLKTGADPCELWCSQPLEKLKEYCTVIKTIMFWPLLFSSDGNSFVDENGLHVVRWDRINLCESKVLEDLADLFTKVVNIPHFIRGILRIGTGIENGFFNLAEALDWVRCVGGASILQDLEKLGDYGKIKLAILFTDCECGHPKMGKKRKKSLYYQKSSVLEKLGDCGLVRLSILFAECEYGHPKMRKNERKITLLSKIINPGAAAVC